MQKEIEYETLEYWALFFSLLLNKDLIFIFLHIWMNPFFSSLCHLQIEPSEFNFDESLLWNCQLEPELLQRGLRLDFGVLRRKDERHRQLRLQYQQDYVCFLIFFSPTFALCVFPGSNNRSWCSKVDRTKKKISFEKCYST